MGHDTLPNLAAFVLQVCVIAVVAAVVLGALRIASAGTRYLCWRLVLAACLAMPFLLQRTVPAETLDAALPRVSTGVVAGDVPVLAVPAATVQSAPAPQPMPWDTIAMLIVAAGVAARGAWLAIGLFRLRALRQSGQPVDDEDYDEIQRTLGTRATLRTVAGLTQPATFGLWRPVVLLPAALGECPLALRRAVVTHELFHVQRRDWVWVLAEELTRSLLWFHPAIFWLTSRVQLAREELVDELTVLATGNRKVYIEALLAFVDAGCARPAPAFARRRHLFTRILRLSKERAMSSPRIVVSAAAVIVGVVAAGWYASVAFPILSAAPVEAFSRSSSTGTQPSGLLPRYQVDRLIALVVGQSAPPPVAVGLPAAPTAASAASQGPRGGGAARPGPAPAPAPARQAAQSNPVTPENPIPRRVYSVPVPYPQELQGSGSSAAVEVRVAVDGNGVPTPMGNRTSVAMSQPDASWLAARSGIPAGAGSTDPAAARAQLEALTAQVTWRNAFVTAALESIGQWRYDAPAQAPLEFSIAIAFAPGKDGVVTQSSEPRGVSAAGGRVSVGTYSVTGSALDPAGRVPSAQLAEIDRQQLDLAKKRGDLVVRLNAQHPDVLKIDAQLRDLALRREKLLQELRQQTAPAAGSGQPIRVGGNIRPPTKTKHVNPVYPPDAQAERVQGVVILEVTISETGQVSDARVLRSIPLLDEAAVEAVRQWEFTPTLLNGAPVAVIMTVTVQFSLN